MASIAALSRCAQSRTIRIDMTLFLKGLFYEQSFLREGENHGESAPEAGHASNRKTNSCPQAASQSPPLLRRADRLTARTVAAHRFAAKSGRRDATSIRRAM